jgi:LPXTG-motif cell wall-anchored protein
MPSFDLSGLTSLTVLDCSDTGRTSLDVSALTKLTYFYCSDNALTSLDVSALIWLAELDCSGNALTSLDASLTRETPPDVMSLMSASLFGSEDDPYINTVGNPLTQITVDVDGIVISLAATSGGYVEIDGDNYEFIAKPKALGRFVNWTAEGGSEVATTETVAFNYDTAYNLTANFELMEEVPVGISCAKTDATTNGGSDGSVTITASGGNSGSYEYSINGGASWQASGYFSGLAASTYTAAVRDAANTSNVATQNVTVGQPAGIELTLSSSVSGGRIYIGGRITLTPNIDGGTWDWDHDYFTATFNSPATFTALKAGTSTITYTVGGVSTTYDVTIGESGLPNTGQDFSWVWALCGAALILVSAGMLIQRRRASARIS